jgi:phospholipid/cholesterol/gamma-HCH transport system substrate-binding protein
MITRRTKVQLAIFAIITMLGVTFVGARYAQLNRLFYNTSYTVVAHFKDSGGMYAGGLVSYRGVPVGQVHQLVLTHDGVDAYLAIDDGWDGKIPSDTLAVVGDKSAVGEQYVDLQPQGDSGPYLRNGSIIPQRETQLPLPVTSLLTSINQFAASVPLKSLGVVVDQLGTAFGGQGSNLNELFDGSSKLVRASTATIPQQLALISDAQTVLRTQAQESGALRSFGASARQLAAQLDASDADLRRLIVTAPRAAIQVSGLLTDNNPDLAIMLANLLTTSELTATRGPALDELLSALPAAVAAGSTVINDHGANFGLALTFFDPLPCTSGYAGTRHRNGLDTAPAPLNTQAGCDLPASSGVDVRGSAHAPSGGAAPAPAHPGLATLLGLSP